MKEAGQSKHNLSCFERRKISENIQILVIKRDLTQTYEKASGRQKGKKAKRGK